MIPSSLYLSLVLLIVLQLDTCSSFVPSTRTYSTSRHTLYAVEPKAQEAAAEVVSTPSTEKKEDVVDPAKTNTPIDDEDDDEYEYLEYEVLTEWCVNKERIWSRAMDDGATMVVRTHAVDTASYG